jgi:hypothetical protein
MSWPAAQLFPHGSQADGQKLSDVPLHARAVLVHLKVQAATVPARVRMVLASLTQASDWVWQAEGGSQASPLSTAEFPHTGMQLLSLLALHVGGQHMSPFMQAVCMPEFIHRTLHMAAVPCSVRC